MRRNTHVSLPIYVVRGVRQWSSSHWTQPSCAGELQKYSEGWKRSGWYHECDALPPLRLRTETRLIHVVLVQFLDVAPVADVQVHSATVIQLVVVDRVAALICRRHLPSSAYSSTYPQVHFRMRAFKRAPSQLISQEI